MNNFNGRRIHINGIVQGVGFRPFVYRIAHESELTGWVQNTSAGVDIHIEGNEEKIERFLTNLEEAAPPLAYITEISVTPTEYLNCRTFEISPSKPIPDSFQPVSPDVSICGDCINELFDPEDRRYFYPFINCTNCGPRFTIIQDIPYDRPKTTMSSFPMCPDCLAEYNDPLDRRFHAQPVACPICGPQVWLNINQNSTYTEHQIPDTYGPDAVHNAIELLANGKILAIKGIGGFHLACDAQNTKAVSELRLRKRRVDKPYAIMVGSFATAQKHCFISPAERRLLESPERPIILLQRRSDSRIVRSVAPNINQLGIMLPYTPLHYLLFSDQPNDNKLSALVMTSGNLSEEPIAIENEDALSKLHQIADGFLMHNRPIFSRCDDSVITVINSDKSQQNSSEFISDTKRNVYPLRRSRGYAPFPIPMQNITSPILAVGAELKNTFCITKERYAFISQHIGDLENYETFQSFEAAINHYEQIFRVNPEYIAHDLHPNYLSTRYALQRSEDTNIPIIGIQHHHAHIVAGMADNNLNTDTPVIGIAFDGTGFGTDEAIWGGEFLLSSFESYQRAAHLKYFPLPGGDAAIRKPARTALAYLWQSDIDWHPDIPCVSGLSIEERRTVKTQLMKEINTHQTSSMGRLFDAVAAISGVRQTVNYEAQAAIELESLIDNGESGHYDFNFEFIAGVLEIDPAPVVQAVANEFLAGKSPATISARFHNGLAVMVTDVCKLLRSKYSVSDVVLSGGVWQNRTLLGKTIKILTTNGFSTFTHHQVPANDGGISYGQAIIAAASL